MGDSGQDNYSMDMFPRFPATRHSAILALRSGEREQLSRAYGAIAMVYWKPVYKYIRSRWKQNRDDAADLTQGFFARVIERQFFADYDPARARFRTYLRLCLDRFIGNELKAQSRLRRGGGQEMLSYDFEAAERELGVTGPPAESPEKYFEREWVRALLESAVGVLQQRCEDSGRKVHFALFSRYDLARFDSDDRVTYQELADRHGIGITDVTNHLAAVRREFREIVLTRIRELTASDDEYRREVRAVLGIDAP
jgi:RNA polymerase sigma factor (sigma-70 family)